MSRVQPIRPAELNAYFANIQSLKGVGAKTADSINRVMGPRIKDLVLTPPTQLIDRTYRPTIAGAMSGDVATFEVTVGKHIKPSNRNRPYKVRAFDETGDIILTWFKAYPNTIQKLLPEGSRRLISGKCKVFNAELQMTHPDYVVPLDKAGELPPLETIYPLTAGLGQKMARKAVNAALDKVLAAETIGDWLDPNLMKQQDWPEFLDALTLIHRPEHPVDIQADSPIRRRLAYDEIFAKQLAMALVRERNRSHGGRSLKSGGTYVDDVLEASPFPPTNAQKRAFEDRKSVV